MKKTIIISVFIIVLLLSACGKKQDIANAATESSYTEEVIDIEEALPERLVEELYLFDENGYPTSTQTFNKNGDITSFTEYTYNSEKQLAIKIEKSWYSDNVIKTLYTYNSVGQRSFETIFRNNEESSRIEYEYTGGKISKEITYRDSAPSYIVKYDYNSHGNISKITENDTTSDPPEYYYFEEYSYDSNYNLTKMVSYVKYSDGEIELIDTTEFFYENGVLIKAISDMDGPETIYRYNYDNVGNLEYVEWVEYEYDPDSDEYSAELQRSSGNPLLLFKQPGDYTEEFLTTFFNRLSRKISNTAEELYDLDVSNETIRGVTFYFE